MNEKNQKHFNKFDEAIGLFWGAALFIGALTAVISGFSCNDGFVWLPAVLIGAFTFLSLGLIFQGVLTLIKKGDREN